MFPMKNPILGIESPYLESLIKPISISEKIWNLKSKFWIWDFFPIFELAFSIVKYDFLEIALTFSILVL